MILLLHKTRFEDYEQQRCTLIAGFVVGMLENPGIFPLWFSIKSNLRYTAAVSLFTFMTISPRRFLTTCGMTNNVRLKNNYFLKEKVILNVRAHLVKLWHKHC